jgi:ABC-type antimicrobial peptide transport system permease subunit
VAAEAIAEPRFRAGLVGLFALLALALAAAGVFGVLAFAVNQRLREFGIRLALGARPSDVARLVIGSALRIIAAGVAAGTIAAAVVGRVLTALLFGVRPLDPVALAAPAALLLFVALAACAAPALRAVRVDPAVSLRVE